MDERTMVEIIRYYEEQINYLEGEIRQLTEIIVNNPNQSGYLSDTQAKHLLQLTHLKKVYWELLDRATRP